MDCLNEHWRSFEWGLEEKRDWFFSVIVSAGFFSAYTFLYIMNLGSHTFQFTYISIYIHLAYLSWHISQEGYSMWR